MRSDLASNPTLLYRFAVAVAVGTALVLVWSVGALGIIGPGGPKDLVFVSVLGVALVGAVVARFRARGMALALGATAAATVLAGVVAVAAGFQDTEGASVVEILGLSAFFAAPFAFSAWLFGRSAQARSDAAYRGHL